MKIQKIGSLDENNVIYGNIPPNLANILTTMEIPDTDDYVDSSFSINIGQGAARRSIKLEIVLSKELLNSQMQTPIILNHEKDFVLVDKGYEAYFLFKNKFFILTTNFLEGTSQEEANLLIKRQAFSEDNKLNRLRKEVEVMERIVNQQVTVRTSIPESVKLLVYARDNGKCVKCGSTEKLHFDHIIPVSKGGGNSEANIQILCEYCNLQKSDKIAF